MRTLPPFSALRAFEAVARLASVSKAAAELNVTHPAISHQIKQLEAHFEQPLLVKQGRGVVASKAGEQLSAVLTETFHAMGVACERIFNERERQTLVVACIASVASRWLIPLLPAFAAKHPNVQLRIVYAAPHAELIEADIDILIRACDGPYRGPYSVQPLFSGATRPVCSPALLERLGPMDSPQALFKAPLLHDENNRAWRQWFASAGLPTGPLAGMQFADFNLMSTAAVAGQGIALCPLALIREDLLRGHLVQLAPMEANTERNYLLLHRPDGPALVSEFREWLLGEVAEGA